MGCDAPGRWRGRGHLGGVVALCLIHPADVFVDLGVFDAPLAAAADLDTFELARLQQGPDLSL